MKKLLVCAALSTSLFSSASVMTAAPVRGGSNCVDVVLNATCTANVVTGTGTLKNCGTGADTITLTELLLGPNGETVFSETGSVPLKAGKTFTYTASQQVSSSADAGTYVLTVVADAEKGTGYDKATLSITIPCK